MSRRKQKRSVKARKKQTATKNKPEIIMVHSSPDAKIARLIEKDQRYFAAKPHINWFTRPAVPGEFKEIERSSDIDLSTIEYTLVQRAGPNDEQVRVPMTPEMVRSWVEYATKDEGGDPERSQQMDFQTYQIKGGDLHEKKIS